MHRVINSWKSLLQSWHKQSSSWWVLDVRRGRLVCAGFSSSSLFAFTLPQIRDLPTPEMLDPQCKSFSWGEEKPSLHLTSRLVASHHPQLCRCEGEATSPSLLHCCLRPVPRDTPGRGTAKSVVADRTIDLAAFLSQLCEDVPYQHSPGSLENATGHDTSAGWLRRHIPGLGTHYSSWDMAGSCPQKALVKLAA